MIRPQRRHFIPNSISTHVPFRESSRNFLKTSSVHIIPSQDRDTQLWLRFWLAHFLSYHQLVICTVWNACSPLQRHESLVHLKIVFPQQLFGLPLWLSGEESTCHCRRYGFKGCIREWGRSPGEGNSNSLQYSSLRNPTGRGAWWGYSPGGRNELART